MAGWPYTKVTPRSPPKQTTGFYDSGRIPDRVDGRPSLVDFLPPGITDNHEEYSMANSPNAKTTKGTTPTRPNKNLNKTGQGFKNKPASGGSAKTNG